MQKITLKNIRLIKNDQLLLSNVNLDLNFNQNVVIVPEKDGDIRSVQALIKIIAGNYKPNNGSVNYDANQSNRIMIGYKNLEHLFKRNVSVIDFLNTLIHTQKIDDRNLYEIKEILGMFRINKSLMLNKLEHNSLNLLNLLTLLIIKPNFILIDHLSLPGSGVMQLSILQYIKEYCEKHKINLIISSNDEQVIDAIANRIVVIANKQIKSDELANANETLEDDILKALNLKDTNAKFNDYDLATKRVPTNVLNDDDSNYYQNISNAKQADEDLIYQVTKALNDSFEDDIIISMKTDEIITPVTTKTNSSITNVLFTNKYETDLDNSDVFSGNKNLYKNNREDDKPIKTTSLNKQFTGSLEFEREEIKQKTKRFNDESKEVLQDIKFSQQKQAQPTKDLNDNYFETNNSLIDEENYVTKEFLSEIKETYAMRKALSDQIKSPDFSKLTPELQHKVFQNHDAADRLIKEIDPEGKYDPSKIKSHITKRIINNNNHNTSKTVTSAMISEQLSSMDDDNQTSTRTNDSDDLHITTYSWDKFNNPDYEEETFKTTKFNDDHEKEDEPHYFDNQKKHKTKKSPWRFGRKDNRKQNNQTRNVEYSKSNDDYKNNNYKNNNKNNTRYVNNESSRNDNYVENKFSSYKNYEPTSALNKNKHDDIVLPNKKYKTNHFSTDEMNTEPKKLKTMAIKQRSKRNLIEKLYDEAVEDSAIIKEYKEKKNNRE